MMARGGKQPGAGRPKGSFGKQPKRVAYGVRAIAADSGIRSASTRQKTWQGSPRGIRVVAAGMVPVKTPPS
jgi:hypothetical protein